MRKDNVDWQKFAESLLWHIIVYDKNADSGYDMMSNGEIGCFRFSSIIDPFSYRHLTWKELALELGLFKEYLTPDGINVKVVLKKTIVQHSLNMMKTMNVVIGGQKIF
jgi:hypothetical protein